MRREVIAALAAAAALLCPAQALPGQAGPLVRQGELLGGATDSGLVLLVDDVPVWSCAEALGLDATFWHLGEDGVLVAGTAEGVRRSEDGGCSWSPAWGALGELAIGGLAAVGDVDGQLLVSAEGTGLWRSLDGGAQWEELAPLPGGFAPGPLVVDSAGERPRVSATDADGLPHVLASDDGGDSWLEPYELSGWAEARLVLLRPDGQGLYLAAISGLGDDFLVALDPDLTSGPHALAMPPGPVVGAAMVGDDLLYVARGEGLYRRAPGGDPEPIPGGPTQCLAALDGRVWGCSDGAAYLAVSDDGELWTPLVSWQDVVPRDCPAGTSGAELCPEVWEALQGDDDDSAEVQEPQDDDDSGDPSGDEGEAADCSCAAARGPASGGLLLVLTWGAVAAASRGSRLRRRSG